MLDPLAQGFFTIKNKTDTFGKRLLAIFRSCTMYSADEHISPKHIINMIPDVDLVQFDCAMAYIYSHRFTVLSYICSMPGRDKLWPQKEDTTKANFIYQFVLKSPPSENASDEYIFSWWVGKYLRDWIVNQRMKEVEVYRRFKSSTKSEHVDFVAYHQSGGKNCGCFFPPSKSNRPNPDEYKAAIPDDFKGIFTAIHKYLNHTSYRWGYITASGINNEIPSLVKVVFSGFRNLSYYRSLIAQDPIWTALVEIRGFISNDVETTLPCWLETPSMPRISSKVQRFKETEATNNIVVAIVEKSVANIDKNTAETVNKLIKMLTLTFGIPCNIASLNPEAGTEIRLPISMKVPITALVNVSILFIFISFNHFLMKFSKSERKRFISATCTTENSSR